MEAVGAVSNYFCHAVDRQSPKQTSWDGRSPSNTGTNHLLTGAGVCPFTVGVLLPGIGRDWFQFGSNRISTN